MKEGPSPQKPRIRVRDFCELSNSNPQRDLIEIPDCILSLDEPFDESVNTASNVTQTMDLAPPQIWPVISSSLPVQIQNQSIAIPVNNICPDTRILTGGGIYILPKDPQQQKQSTFVDHNYNQPQTVATIVNGNYVIANHSGTSYKNSEVHQTVADSTGNYVIANQSGTVFNNVKTRKTVSDPTKKGLSVKTKIVERLDKEKMVVTGTGNHRKVFKLLPRPSPKNQNMAPNTAVLNCNDDIATWDGPCGIKIANCQSLAPKVATAPEKHVSHISNTESQNTLQLAKSRGVDTPVGGKVNVTLPSLLSNCLDRSIITLKESSPFNKNAQKKYCVQKQVSPTINLSLYPPQPFPNTSNSESGRSVANTVAKAGNVSSNVSSKSSEIKAGSKPKKHVKYIIDACSVRVKRLSEKDIEKWTNTQPEPEPTKEQNVAPARSINSDFPLSATNVGLSSKTMNVEVPFKVGKTGVPSKAPNPSLEKEYTLSLCSECGTLKTLDNFWTNRESNEIACVKCVLTVFRKTVKRKNSLKAFVEQVKDLVSDSDDENDDDLIFRRKRMMRMAENLVTGVESEK